MKELAIPPYRILPREHCTRRLPESVDIAKLPPISVFPLPQGHYFYRELRTPYVCFNGHKRRATAIERGILIVPVIVAETLDDLARLKEIEEWHPKWSLPGSYEDAHREFTDPQGICHLLHHEFGISDPWQFLKQETARKI